MTASPARAGTLYGINEVLGYIYTIDTSTGAATLVATMSPWDSMNGIAFDSDGMLHGVTWESVSDTQLWELDLDTEVGSAIGLTGDISTEGALAYDPSTDRFYSIWRDAGADGEDTRLIWINPDTGAGTLIGNLGMDAATDVSGMTFLPDGTLLAYDPRPYTLPSRILEIDPATGVTTVVGDGDLGDVWATSIIGGLAYDPDTETLYMSNAVELWEIDPATGEGTLPSAFSAYGSALSFNPSYSLGTIASIRYVARLVYMQLYTTPLHA